jgi:type II secretory pathway pseudopilin PulG
MVERTLRFRRRAAFTLVEVLASLLMMAIIIPVAIEGMSVASRVGMLGQRKAAAMRVAERVLNELLVETQIQQASSSGTAYEGDTSYPWVMRTENWPEDAMQQMTVTVSFSVQGALHEVSVATLMPNIAAADTTLGTQQ